MLAAVLYPLIPISWATALMGCVNQDLPFVPTVLTQLACSFLNLITPNGIGGTALQLDYLHKQGVPVASGGSAMVLSTGVGGAIQMVLFLDRRGHHRDCRRHEQQLVRQRQPVGDRGRRRARRRRALHPEDPGQGRSCGEARRERHLGGAPQPEEGGAALRRRPRRQPHLSGAARPLSPRLPPAARLRAAHRRAGRRRHARQRRTRCRAASACRRPRSPPASPASASRANAALATVLVFRAITFAIPPIFGFFTLRWLRAKGYA